jgi:hypothetical protein
MIDHPLFNGDNPDDAKKRKLNIAYINIRVCEPGKKKVTLTNQWEPEELLTPADVLEAVGGNYGAYELIGRGVNHQVVDTQMIVLGAPKGYVPPAPAAAPTNGQPATPSTPMMQAGGLLIPANMDPTTAMIISMMAVQMQQSAASADRQDRQAQFAQQQLTTLMTGMAASQSGLVTGLVGAFAPALISRGGSPGDPTASSNAEAGFLKGIEIMAAMKAGLDEAGSGGKTDWATVTTNIMQSVKSLAEVAKATAAAPAPAPVVPPGGPAAT